jgi:hypothetical protein
MTGELGISERDKGEEEEEVRAVACQEHHYTNHGQHQGFIQPDLLLLAVITVEKNR